MAVEQAPRGTYAILTFGCRVNQADSFTIEAALRNRGAEAASPETADLVVVNTCSVTASADQSARQAIRRVSRANPHARIVVTGCYATRRPDEVRGLPNVVQVVSNPDKDHLLDDVRDLLPTAERFGAGDGPCGAPLTPGVAGRTALTLRVQTGCNEPCSYCIIPQTRGAQRSRPLDMVLHDVHHAVAAGYREIAITGVHLGSYGRDLGDGTALETLVRRLADWPADVRFRISSLEPMDCSRELVAIAADSPRIAPHFHLPLQHGHDEMLQAMRRPYTVAVYRQLVDAIHARIPHAALGTDLIVGFPGERGVHAEATAALVASLPLAYLHVFPYSDRPGTDASSLGGKVDGMLVRERGRALRAIGRELAHRFRASQTGVRHRALTVDDGRWAVTGNYLRVPLAQACPRNEWVDVVL